MGTLPAPPAALRSPGRPGGLATRRGSGESDREPKEPQGPSAASDRRSRWKETYSGAAGPPRRAPPTGHLAAPGPAGCPLPPRPGHRTCPSRQGAARAVTAARAPRVGRPRAGRGARCGRPGANFPAGAPGPGPAAGHRVGSAAQTAGPRGRALGTAEGRAPEALPARGCAEPGAARASEPTTRAPGRSPVGLAAEPRGAPPRGPGAREPDSCDGGNSGFAKRAQPLGGKVPAVAAGGGHILTFSTRGPERERGGEKQESPQRGRGPSSGARLHSFYLGRNSPFSKKKGGVEEEKKKSPSLRLPPTSKSKGEGDTTPRGGAGRGSAGRRGRGGRWRRAALSAGSRGPALGRVGNPGRAGAGCLRRRPPFSNPERQEGGKTAKRRGPSPDPSWRSQTNPTPDRGGGGPTPEPPRREGATQFARLPRSPGRGGGRPGAEMRRKNE